MNELLDWANECLMRDSALDDFTTRLTESYEEWCRVHRRVPVKTTRWGTCMRKLGCEPVGGGSRKWKGCRLVSKDPMQP
jgi:hypothetical protein